MSVLNTNQKQIKDINAMIVDYLRDEMALPELRNEFYDGDTWGGKRQTITPKHERMIKKVENAKTIADFKSAVQDIYQEAKNIGDQDILELWYENFEKIKGLTDIQIHKSGELWNKLHDNHNFWRWFQGTHEIFTHTDKVGRTYPNIYYRGLSGVSQAKKLEVNIHATDYGCEYFATNPLLTSSYSGVKDNPFIEQVFLNAKKPFIFNPIKPKHIETLEWDRLLYFYSPSQAVKLFKKAGFDKKFDDWEKLYVKQENIAKTDDTVSFYLQIDHKLGIELITDNKINDMDFQYQSGKIPTLEEIIAYTIGTNNFFVQNLKQRDEFDSFYAKNILDIGWHREDIENYHGEEEMKSDIIAVWGSDDNKAFAKEIGNTGEFSREDNRIFYSLFDIETDKKQEMQTEKEKTMENQVSGSIDAQHELPTYNKYIAGYIRDFVNDDSNFTPIGQYKYEGVVNWYDLEKLAQRNGGIEHFAKLFEQYKSSNQLGFGQTWRYRYMNETIEMLRNPVLYKDKLEKSISDIQQRVTELYVQIDRENFGTEKRADLNRIKDGLLSAVDMENKRLSVVKDYIQSKQRKLEQEKQIEQTQTTADNGGFSLSNNPENTVNYDLRGLPEFSHSVSAYFNNPERQALVLEFLKTAERSKELYQQSFIGVLSQEQKQFEQIAMFSPLTLSAILDCKPDFANNMREYMAVIADFEHNNQQQLAAHKKAENALRISPAYQEMSDLRKNWAEIDLHIEYIDGGKSFAFTKNGDTTNKERLKNAMHNVIDAIAPAVKYSLSQQEFWQERDDLAFIVQPQIRDLLRSQMGFPAELIEVKTRHQIWHEDRAVYDTLSNNTSGFFTPKNGKTVIVADAFIKRPELAVFTAYHELGHRGIELQGRELWNEWLEQARQNPTVRAIADHTQTLYASKGNILSDITATEEALVEVFAAYKTQNWDYLAQRHNVEIPQEFRKPQGTAEKLWHAAKNKIGQIFGRQPETLPDSAVFAMLGKLEQSLYQFPEWKQKLEKTVRIEQGNPFAVSKQPNLSGSLRVNPTALTNHYRNGGLRFDLNTQDNSNFAKAIDDIVETGKAETIWVNLGTTPDSWQLIGLPDVSVDIHADNMVKSMNEYLDLPKQHYPNGEEKGTHNISPETLKQIPAQLNEPVAIFKSSPTSTNPNGYVVLTELIEADKHTGIEKPIIAALNLKTTKNSLEVLNITSIHGRWRNQIESAIERFDKESNAYVSDLRYWDKTKGHQLANSFELQLPSWLDLLDDLSNRNIKTEQDLLQYQKDKEMEKNQQQGTTTPEIPENTVKQDAFGLPETQMKIDENRFYEITQEKGLVNFIDENVQNGTYEKMPLSMIKLEMKAGLEDLAHWVEYEIDEYYGFYAGTSPDEFEELHKNYTKEERENFVLSHKKEHAKSVQNGLDKYNQATEKVANYFGIEQSQVAEFLGYEEPKETLEQARQIISGSPEQTVEVKQDAFGTPETPKTLNPKEQALADGKALAATDEKVKNAEWEYAKRPGIRETYNNLQAAITERDALNEEIKPRVQAAMDSGKPYIVEYTEDGKPFELVVTQNGNLKMALGSYDEEPHHNHLLSTGNGEVALNAEQRSTPERVAEVLKYNFNHKHSDIGEKLALINYPNADKVFSENQIKDTLNKALKSPFKIHQLAAIKSPVMRGDWLQSIAANSEVTEEIRQAAKNEMAERFGIPESKPQGQVEHQTLKQTATNGGVFCPQHNQMQHNRRLL